MFKKIISAFLVAFCIISSSTVFVSAISTKELAQDKEHVSESKFSHDPSAMATEITEKLEDTAHPYILYSEDDIPTLKEKVGSGLSKKAYERVMTTAENYLKKSISVNSSSSGIIGRQLQSYVTYLSMAGMLSGESKYIEKAISLAVSAAEQGNVDRYLGINDALCVGDFGHAYALAYDWLYQDLTDDQRSILKSELEEIGGWIYENSEKIDTWGSQLDRRKAWNWNAVTHGALGLISLSLGDKPQWLALAIRRTTDYYDFAVDDTGAAMEGLHYIGYALNSLAPFDGAIYKLTDIEMMDDYPEMQSMPTWSMLYMTLPQGGRQAAIGQANEMGNYSAPYYIINRYSLAEELWGFENTYSLSEDGQFGAEYEGNGWSCPAIILFEDQGLTPQAPTGDSVALTQEFAKGLVISRDSWESDAAMLTFTCGVGFAGCWNHPDDNSFTFSARGDAFVIDLGSGHLSSAEHNVVQIDGKGMSYEGGSTMVAGDLQENTTLENGNLYLRGSNLSSYWKSELKSSTRQVVFAGGDVPFVIVYDYMRKDSESHTFTTNYYIDSGAKIEVSSNARYATITGKNSGESCYVFSGASDFVFFSSNGNCITTETDATMLCQATVFIMSNPDGSMPEVEFESLGKDFMVTLTRAKGEESITETYVFGLESLQDFTTTEDLTVTPPVDTETETEEITEATEPTETETATTHETEPSTSVIETESTQENEPEEETDKKGHEGSSSSSASSSKSGCMAGISTATVPIAIATSAFIIKKKKKQ